MGMQVLSYYNRTGLTSFRFVLQNKYSNLVMTTDQLGITRYVSLSPIDWNCVTRVANVSA